MKKHKISYSDTQSFSKIVQRYTEEKVSKNRKEALNILNENKKVFRTLLGNSCRHQLRIVPELVFYLDDSAEYAEEIENLLKK